MSKIRYIMWWIYKLSHVFAKRGRERLGREMIGWSEKERKKRERRDRGQRFRLQFDRGSVCINTVCSNNEFVNCSIYWRVYCWKGGYGLYINTGLVSPHCKTGMVI